ncbi:MAG: hypothetical protein ABF261_03280 [Candidatus Arcticimaribacter sp.]
MYKKHLHLVFLLLLYGCTKTEEDCQANSFQYPTQVCIQLYEPVCGCNNITYSNACIAESWGVVQFSQGACTN